MLRTEIICLVSYDYIIITENERTSRNMEQQNKKEKQQQKILKMKRKTVAAMYFDYADPRVFIMLHTHTPRICRYNRTKLGPRKYTSMIYNLYYYTPAMFTQNNTKNTVI